MYEHRSLKLDLIALMLLAAVIFLAASLLSYDRADPPNHLIYSHAEGMEIRNMCGLSGAYTSWAIFELVGVGGYFLVLSLAGLDFVLLTRRPVGQGWVRTIGWAISLLGVTTLAAMAVPSWSPGPVIGSGGYLGAMGSRFLELHFARLGSYIITISILAGGLLLSTDYLMVHLISWIIRKPARGFGRSVLHIGTAYAEKLQRKRTDLDSFEFATDQIAVKRAGRPVEELETTEKVEIKTAAAVVAAADEEEDEEEEAEAASGPTFSTPADRKAKKNEHEEMIEELEADQVAPHDDYELPSIELLLPGEPFCYEEQEKDVRRKAKILEKTFLDFGFNVRVVEIQTGPVIAQFEVELEAGLRLSKITSLADDIAIALRVPSVRIVAPIPGKNTVGIEIPNNERQVVRMREVMEEANGKALKMRIPIYLGKDVAGNPLLVDLTTLPHLLIAGRTGTGKSVCLNTIIASMIMTRRPDEVRMLMIDPKMVELSPYKSLPHLMHPVVTDMRKAEAILGWAVEKMEERYHLLARAGVRHISVYNQLGEEELMERVQPESEEERNMIPLQMPYIVIVADEMADLMMTSAKEVEQHIIRLAQKSRAVGIHLVLATQKPTVDVITGLIKSNLPARISFQVASRTDSRVVLDEMGADKLLGNGDLLFLWPGTSTLIRGQGTYLSDDEINKVIAAVATDEPQFVHELVQLKPSNPEGGESKSLPNRDDLYEAAVDVVIREGRGSVSLLQRALGIGYGRAARLVDFMAEDGIVGQYNGSQAREVMITLEQWATMQGGGSNSGVSGGVVTPQQATVEPPKPRRTNKIQIAAPKRRPELFEEEEEPPFDVDRDHMSERDEEVAEDDERPLRTKLARRGPSPVEECLEEEEEDYFEEETEEEWDDDVEEENIEDEETEDGEVDSAEAEPLKTEKGLLDQAELPESNKPNPPKQWTASA